MLKICYNTCCGIDVHKKMLVATIATTNERKVTTYQTKQFSTFTIDNGYFTTYSECVKQ